jgi:hypothetical protein
MDDILIPASTGRPPFERGTVVRATVALVWTVAFAWIGLERLEVGSAILDAARAVSEAVRTLGGAGPDACAPPLPGDCGYWSYALDTCMQAPYQELPDEFCSFGRDLSP